MKQTKLKSLSLENFKGIEKFTLDIDGKNADILGNNGTGKTRLFDAFSYAMSGKDSLGKADFEIKNLDQTGEAQHGLEHIVTAVLDIDGTDLELKKIYSEKWTKKRGSVTPLFTGHKTDYYLNSVPVPKTEYQKKIESLASPETIKILTNPLYFAGVLPWEKRRAILLTMAGGDITDQDIINTDPDLATLPEILGTHTLDEYKKIIKARRTKINDELKKVPVRIDEIKKSLANVTETKATTKSATQAAITDWEIKKAEAEAEKLRLENGGELAIKKQELSEIISQKTDIETESKKKNAEEVVKVREDQAVNTSVITLLENDIKKIEINTQDAEKSIQKVNQNLENLRTEWHKENEKNFNIKIEDNCPTCGQVLPGNMKETIRTAHEEIFNTKKAEALKKINEGGKLGNKTKEELEAKLPVYQKEIQDIETKLTEREEMAKIFAESVEIAQAKKIPANIEYLDIIKKKTHIESQINALQSGDHAEQTKDAGTKISNISQHLERLQETLATFSRTKEDNARIKELGKTERALAAEYEKLEGELLLTENFTKAKVSQLEDKINAKFRLIKWKMFETQINEGIKECCEAIFEGVPYNTNLNAGHQIICGMDAINTMSDHHNLSLPIFIDNAESVTKMLLPDMGNTQIIRLIKPRIITGEDVERYSQLNIEMEGE